MRVDWLYLKDFKNLNDFKVDFDLTSERQVVVGRNSVGKSNVLEALAWIFRDLDLEEDSEFEGMVYRGKGDPQDRRNYKTWEQAFGAALWTGWVVSDPLYFIVADADDPKELLEKVEARLKKYPPDEYGANAK